jgi:hypothetical protein
MTTLNRFPLLGLWAKEAARRVGYKHGEAEALGHAYAVLYAIRARGKPKPSGEEKKPARRHRKRVETEQVHFGGDDLDVIRDEQGKLQGLVGGEHPQTPATYHAAIETKFPDGYYEKLEKVFRLWLKKYFPKKLDSRLIYNLYDQWKRKCGKGRLVDLDCLLSWCEEQARATTSSQADGA